jgi:vacuolar protein sorting-associated protein VTA1
LQQKELEQQREIPSAPTLPSTDSEFHLASEPTHKAPQNEPSSSVSNIEFSVSSAPLQLPDDLDRPHPGWAEPADYASESWSTVATSDIPDPPSLNNTALGWGGISSDTWSDDATELNGPEKVGVKAHSRSSSDAIEWSGEELPSKRASQGVEVKYSPISSMGILPEPDKTLYLSSSTHSPQPHVRSSTSSTHTSPQSPLSSSLPQLHETFVQQSPSTLYPRSRAPPPPPVPIQEDPVELTPGIIAKAQKHCRFAVSALNYDDVEQAKKELRAALALLGG